MALGSEVVYLIRLDIIDKTRKLTRIGKVAIMEEKLCTFGMGICVDMVNSSGVKGTGSTDEAMNFISLG
jgi:hypothetical protein